jgi:uncharacterized protein (DUF427 family)
MALTMGSGPFGPTAAGQLNFERPDGHVLLLDPIFPRIRGVLNGRTVVDSRRAHLLHETGYLPVWYFPREDVDFDLLEPTDHSTYCPFKGDASYWTVRAGEAVAENAVWGYTDPIDEAPDIADKVAFYFRQLDEWWQEEEPVVGHPRDPYHRIDVLPTSLRVEVKVDGETLAESSEALVLLETGLPPRFYLPREHVRLDAAEDSDRRTTCAYKGHASYWSFGEEDDLAWTYDDPLHDAEPVKDRIAFFNERVDLELDGELQERPVTPWSRR